MSPSTRYSQSDAVKALNLGQATEYISTYSPDLLRPVPRSLNRNELELGDSQPFHGCDVWNLYELSWLNAKGKPVVATGEVRLPATSTNLVESKSFKLYLNSLNQTRFDSVEQVRQTLAKDLSECAQGDVEVVLYAPLASAPHQLALMPGENIDDLDIEVDDYEFDAHYLEGAGGSEIVSETLCSDLLKSNCLVTNQPDWGSVTIDYRGPKLDREKLLRYLISFRQHNEFHEQCVERIFVDLKRFCQPEALTVYARYTRRGGLDINPFRSDSADAKPDNARQVRQ